tara:strand:+ start:234 stop:422 length:189 start_codon:yes stop_codon:yes gene_type:complete
MSKWDEMKAAMEEARVQMNVADSMANEMARMLKGRCRKVNTWNLKDLKKELKDFNAQTGEWK